MPLTSLTLSLTSLTMSWTSLTLPLASDVTSDV